MLEHIRELVELENDRDEARLVLEEEELADFADALERGERCRKLYMSCELLPDGRQSALLAQYGVQVHSVPDYYYQEAEEG